MRVLVYMLALATLLTVLDSIAKGVEVFHNAVGVVGNEANTVSKAAADNRDTLAALDDYTVQRDLSFAFTSRATLIRGSNLYPVLQGALVQRALDKHYGTTYGNLNGFLTNQDARVHPNLRLIGFQIDARNAFAPNAVDPVASYVGTGAGTGTYTAGSDLDTINYGEAAMELVVDAMGASARTLRLTMKNFDGSTEQKDVVVGAGTAPGTALGIGNAGDRYVGVSNITTTGGGGLAGDTFHVRSKVERVIAL